MKSFIPAMMLIVAVLSLSGVQNTYAQKETKQAKTVKVEKKQIWNKVCPVMGDEVDPKVKTVEYKGKVIGFCCKSCIKKFQKDPEKAMKRLSEDGTKFISGESSK